MFFSRDTCLVKLTTIHDPNFWENLTHLDCSDYLEAPRENDDALPLCVCFNVDLPFCVCSFLMVLRRFVFFYPLLGIMSGGGCWLYVLMGGSRYWWCSWFCAPRRKKNVYSFEYVHPVVCFLAIFYSHDPVITKQKNNERCSSARPFWAFLSWKHHVPSLSYTQAIPCSSTGFSVFLVASVVPYMIDYPYVLALVIFTTPFSVNQPVVYR